MISNRSDPFYSRQISPDVLRELIFGKDEETEYVACMIAAGWVDPPPIHPALLPGGVTWL